MQGGQGGVGLGLQGLGQGRTSNPRSHFLYKAVTLPVKGNCKRSLIDPESSFDQNHRAKVDHLRLGTIYFLEGQPVPGDIPRRLVGGQVEGVIGAWDGSQAGLQGRGGGGQGGWHRALTHLSRFSSDFDKACILETAN